MSSPLSSQIIHDTILKNSIEYQDIFIQFQSNFLAGLYKRYQGVDTGSLVLYFAKFSHQDILRQKDYDLNFNIGFDNFWQNLKLVSPTKNSIFKIAEDAALPKETARRKILQLINQKVLSKRNSNIGWFPNEQYKESYNLVVQNEIKEVSSLLHYISKKINLPISKDTVEKELKKKFNFYWFHFLNIQLEYLKLWGVQLKDLELVLIALKVASIITSKVKEKNLSHEKIYNNPSMIKEFLWASTDATSVAEVTGIPRATCIRKLEHLVKLKMIAQDKNSKRYFLIPPSISKDLISRKMAQDVTKIFSKFYFTCIRALTTKLSN
jgi:hypothetical protein